MRTRAGQCFSFNREQMLQLVGVLCGQVQGGGFDIRFQGSEGGGGKKFSLYAPQLVFLPHNPYAGTFKKRAQPEICSDHHKKKNEGKKRDSAVRDGVRFFMIIVKICTLYSPMRVFLPVSF